MRDRLSHLFWPAALFLPVAGTRLHKLRLPLSEGLPYAYQDLSVSIVLGLLIYWMLLGMRRKGRSPLVRAAVPLLLFVPAFWISIAGMIVVQTLKVPLNAKLLLQTSDLMFVRSVIGAGSIETSLPRTLLFAGVVPVAALLAARWLELGAVATRAKRWAPLLLVAPLLLLWWGSGRKFPERSRQSNGVFSLVGSSFGVLTERSPKPPPIEPNEFSEKIASFGPPSRREADPRLKSLVYDGAEYDIVVFVLETGVAGLMDLQSPDPRWLPTIRRLAARSIHLSRHLSTYTSSTKSIFSIVTSRYPLPNFRSFVVFHPETHIENWVSLLRDQGYRTGAYASIDGDFDRQDLFLSHQGVASLGDRESLKLPSPHDPTFGSDEVLVDRFLEWVDEGGADPYLFFLFPSNSHYPFFYPGNSILFPGRSNRNRYRNALQYQDWIIEHLFDGLRRRGRLDRTIFVFLPDHGAYFRLNGELEKQPARIVNHHVPVWIDHPRLRGAARPLEFEAATSHVDIGPTLLEMTSRGSSPADWQGRSVLAPVENNRLVFYIDDYGTALVTATNGRWLLQWNRDADSYQAFRWTGDSRAEADPDALTAANFKAVCARLRDFHAFQTPYLESFVRGSEP